MTELTELDKEVLERIRVNREKHLQEKEAKKEAAEDKIEPVIVYTQPTIDEEKREKQRQYAKKHYREKKLVKTSFNAPVSENKKKPHNRGSSVPVIEETSEGTIITWTRYVTDNYLFLPSSLNVKGCVQVSYNTKDKVITIKPSLDS